MARKKAQSAPTRTRQRTRQSTRQVTRTRGRTSSRRGQPPPKQRGLLFKLTFMALLGFGAVSLLDLGVRATAAMELGGTSVGALFDKLVDRMLDNDIPTKQARKKRAAKKTTTSPKPVAPAKPAPPLPKIARAEIKAPAPTRYAKESKGAVERARVASAQAERASLNDVINRALQQ